MSKRPTIIVQAWQFFVKAAACFGAASALRILLYGQ